MSLLNFSRRPNRIFDDPENDDDDGMTCPICLDYWELHGDHRPVCLKCGHIFGESCIRRWLRECAPNQKLCPQCKTKAIPRDIRHLYMRKMVVQDNSEAMRLKRELEEAQAQTTRIQGQLQMATLQIELQEKLMRSLQEQITKPHPMQQQFAPPRSRKLSLEKNMEVSNQAGCRVMQFGPVKRVLLASCKSVINMFNGFGVRNIDLLTYKPTTYLHISQSSIRDIAFDRNEDVLAAATGEKTVRLFSVDTRQHHDSFTPSDTSLIWSCNFDSVKPKLLYLGAQNGTIFSYDIRSTHNYLKEYLTPSDCAPVVSIRAVPPSSHFPFGGFLVCKLVSCFFFEYNSAGETTATKLNIDGPFTSMNYDVVSNRVLISTRPNATHSQVRHIVAELVNRNGAMLQPTCTFFGSRMQSTLSRSCLVNMTDDIYVAAYNEDIKSLQTWSVNAGDRVQQTLAIEDKILDVCPISLNSKTCLSALAEKKCRIFKFSDVNS